MKKDITVSICCVTYNHEKFIKQSILGFLMQKTNFNFEIIIHDDASTDGTTKIIERFHKDYPELIIPIIQIENQWAKGKRITPIAMHKANGKYIALCEGDDYWTDPYKLQKQVDFLEANPDYVMCYHDAKIIDAYDKIISPSKMTEESKRDYSADDIIKGHTFILTLSLVFRNLIKEFPYEYNFISNGDNFLTSLLGNYGKGKYLTDIEPAVYRIHSGGVWSNQNDSMKLNKKINTYYWLHSYYHRQNKNDYSIHYINRIKYLLDQQIPKPEKDSNPTVLKHDALKILHLMKSMLKNIINRFL